MIRLRMLFPSLCFWVLFATGCGARRGGEATDALSLLKAGRCGDALVEAENAERAMNAQTERAVVAFCTIVSVPAPESGKRAVAILRQESGDIQASASAAEMLALTELFPAPVDPVASAILAKAALGAVGFGPFAPKDGIPTDDFGAATRDLSVSVLERSAAALEGNTGGVNAAELLVIWNSCFRLMGGAFDVDDAHAAWRLYMSLASIALYANNDSPNADLTEALLGAVVTVVEVNPAIHPAVRCDLASPFDALKSALAYRRPMLARLENAVKGALGCSRGTLAP